MIEFYYKFFKKNYKAKVKQLVFDISTLLNIEKIPLCPIFNIVLSEKFFDGLSQEEWEKINQLYFTLEKNKKIISKTLSNFLKKDNIPQDFLFVDTFAGCGGLSLGLEHAGFNPIFVNEIDSKSLETYFFNRSLPLENYYCGDIKYLVDNFSNFKNRFKNIDLLVGGPPCQGFSMANRQRILDDPRNKLYKYFLELLSLSQPKFFIMENVKGMMSKSAEVKNNFVNKLGKKYSIEIVLLNAKDFGVPQNRERVFVIGSRLSSVPASLIVSDIIKEKNKNSKFLLKDALIDLPRLDPKTIKNKSSIGSEGIGYKFKPYDYKDTVFEKFINSSKNQYIINHVNRYNNERDVEIYKRLPQGGNSLHESIKDIMPYKNRNHLFKDKYFKLDENQVSKTITSHMKFDCNMYIHPRQSRGLSPREAARIQTFPDNFVFMGYNNNWYMQIGNAVPVKLAEVIGKNIFKYLKKEKYGKENN